MKMYVASPPMATRSGPAGVMRFHGRASHMRAVNPNPKIKNPYNREARVAAASLLHYFGLPCDSTADLGLYTVFDIWFVFSLLSVDPLQERIAEEHPVLASVMRCWTEQGEPGVREMVTGYREAAPLS